jgi:hypothetical protein
MAEYYRRSLPMQDRYAGDIGDFGKFALLRALEGAGLSVGVNWYKTDTAPDENTTMGNTEFRKNMSHAIQNYMKN